MQHVIEEKSPRVPQNNFGWRLVDFGLKSPQRYIIGIRASKDTHGCRNYTVLFAFRSIPDTLRSPTFVRVAFREEEITRLRLAFLYTGSPVPVSSARRWRFSRVPRLPLCVHAPLADPGGVLSTRHGVSRTVPSESSRSSAFPSSCRVILSDHNYTIFGAQSRGLYTRYTWLHTHPYRICTQVHYRFGG